MALKKPDDFKEFNPVVKRKQQFIGLLLAAAFILLCIGVLAYSQVENSKTVDVAWVSVSMTAGTPLTPKNILKHTISKKSYEDYGILTNSATGEKRRAIILWSERSVLENANAAHYLRGNSPLCWDSLSYEQSKEHSYLYQMDGELLKISVGANEFGEILVPGDRINVRASYKEMDYTLLPEEQYLISAQMGGLMSGGMRGVERERQDLLFSSASILDILNSSGKSIYDIYYDLLKQSRSVQLEMLSSDAFKESVKPSEILLQVTPEEVDLYISVVSKGATFVLTLLHRAEGNIILDTVADLTTQLNRQGQVGASQ